MSEHEPPGYDDWFDDPEPPTLESGRGNRPSYDLPAETEEDVWTLPEDDDRRPRRGGTGGDVVLFGTALTRNQIAILAVAALAVFIAILAAAGVFSSGAGATTPSIPTTNQTTTQNTNTTPAVKVPTGTLQSPDHGPQVKLLQQDLKLAGYPPAGPADGVYGPNTMNAVEQFQGSQGLTADGVAGPVTLAKLRKVLNHG